MVSSDLLKGSEYDAFDNEMCIRDRAIASFFSADSANVNGAAAAAFIGILPVIVVFLFLQKYFIQGMVDSAIK